VEERLTSSRKNPLTHEKAAEGSRRLRPTIFGLTWLQLLGIAHEAEADRKNPKFCEHASSKIPYIMMKT